MPDPLMLKKYSNRRLYDTRNSRYVTLEDVAKVIRSGEQVQIQDATTGEDVTAFILTQIVLEAAKRKNSLLPVPVLDGGQIVYQSVEWIKGSPLSERSQILGQQFGILALILLMSFAFYNDIARILG